MRRSIKSTALACLIALSLLAPAGALAGEQADVLTGPGGVSVPLCLNREGAARITDGNVGSYSRFPGLTGATVRLSGEPQGIYLEWRTPPKKFILRQYDGQGALLSKQTVADGPTTFFYPLESGTRRIRITGGDLLLELCDLTVFGPGELPEGVRAWEPVPDKTDLLIVSAHCDDELLFFGGAVPYYAGELKYAVEVAVMSGDRYRQEESMEGLWTAGLRSAPLFLGLPDELSDSLAEAERIWDRDKATEKLVTILRRIKPEVVMTHDVDGEYGHGAHRLTSACVLDAVRLAAEETAYPASAKAYGTWQVKKLYRHLGPKESRTLVDWGTPLAAFGGKTALQVADEGFQKHASQFGVYETVFNPGLHNDWFGLACSTVGPDEARNDLFEHIPAGCLTQGKE